MIISCDFPEKPPSQANTFNCGKSKIVVGIKEGTYKGFDDPRLGTFAALRKRGITPEAIKKMIIDVGIKPHDVTLSWENLYSYNRKILDTTSNRYFFVAEPIELKVAQVPKRGFPVSLPLQPDKPELHREYFINPEENNQLSFWIPKKDVEVMEPEKVFRLMELFNIKIEGKTDNSVTAKFVSESYEDVRKIKVQLIQWIPKFTEFPTQVVMPDASVNEGFAEAYCKKLKPDAIIQFERFGFVRINEVGEKLIAYYAHK